MPSLAAGSMTAIALILPITLTTIARHQLLAIGVRAGPVLPPAHCAVKGGMLATTRQLAMERAPYNIRADIILTEATRRHLAGERRGRYVTGGDFAIDAGATAC